MNKARLYALARIIGKRGSVAHPVAAYEVVNMAIESLWLQLPDSERSQGRLYLNAALRACRRCDPSSTPSEIQELWRKIVLLDSEGHKTFHHLHLGVNLARMEALEDRGLLTHAKSKGGVNFELTEAGRELAGSTAT